MKISALIIILTSFLLSVCGGESNSNATDTPPTGDNADSETQSANGIWEADGKFSTLPVLVQLILMGPR